MTDTSLPHTRVSCVHSINRKSKIRYSMRCVVLKIMPDGRRKISVTHDRYEREKPKPTIMYVDKERLF